MATKKNQPFKRNLEVKLTNTEILEYSKDLTKAIKDKVEAEKKLKSVSLVIKSEIAEFEGRINALSEKVSSGTEYRPVDCTYYFIPKRHKKEIIRMDTGEKVGETDMTEEDFQEKMPLDDEKTA